MKRESIVGKLIHLTKEIRFSEPVGTAVTTQFLTGGMFGLGGLGLQWWYTRQALDTAEDIARMLIQHDSNLANGDADSFKNMIFKSLEQGVFACGLFDGDKVFLRTCDCLFDSRKNTDVNVFGNQLLDLLVQQMANSIDDWLVVYPLYKIAGPSYKLQHDGISALSFSDDKTWVSLASKYPEIQQCKGEFAQTPLWLTCETHGTQVGAQKQAIFRMRQFIAVLFCFLSERGQGVLHRSMATAVTYTYQFPLAPGKVGCGYTRGPCGELLFPLLTNIEVSEEEFTRTQAWYDKFDAASKEAKSRSAIAANFVNYALTHRDIERYIHYFISLDALFGSRNRVEKGIVEGFLKTFNGDEIWAARAEWLFDLRNELTHGGSSAVEQWERLLAYRKHFKTYPDRDVEVAALQSLKLFFN